MTSIIRRPAREVIKKTLNTLVSQLTAACLRTTTDKRKKLMEHLENVERLQAEICSTLFEDSEEIE